MPRRQPPIEFLSAGPTVSWRTIGIVAALQVVVAVLVNQVLFALPVVRTVARVSGGWVQPTLVAAVVVLVCVVGVGIAWLGRLRMADVYWRTDLLLPALAASAAVWAAAQLLVAAAEILRGHPLDWHPSWARAGVGVVGGALLAQVAGNALVEETVFRGFLLPQLTRRLRHVARGSVATLALALLGSQLFFALYHLPNRLFARMPLGEIGADAALLLLMGTVFALLFLLTRNLWLVVGLHALGNRPTALFAASDTTVRAALLISALALLAAWRLAARGVRDDAGRRNGD